MALFDFLSNRKRQPSPSDVVGRAVVLRSLIATAFATPPREILDAAMADLSDSASEAALGQIRELRSQTAKALQSANLWNEMSPAEQQFIVGSPEAVTPQAQRDMSWLMEGFECLVWALGYVEALPPYDTQADIEHLKLLPGGSVRELQASAKLRSPEVLGAARNLAELWHWRSRTRELMDAGTPVALPDGLTLPDVVRLAAEQAKLAGDLTAVVDDDFPLNGSAYARASVEDWHAAQSIAMERHRALNWLCGYARRNRWWETPTDT